MNQAVLVKCHKYSSLTTCFFPAVSITRAVTTSNRIFERIFGSPIGIGLISIFSFSWIVKVPLERPAAPCTTPTCPEDGLGDWTPTVSRWLSKLNKNLHWEWEIIFWIVYLIEKGQATKFNRF